ncbi:uncharacterized protein CDAR_380351 [Caerostris darwini]|uniref:Amiloride-sensitive sodium channel n=1 Tax=Caerostris darwini TaxID=1538125 RepID=A0AAV4TLV6_9ARAC|nr:uncharacterized protein CDAR_380351 [Caerostris darwini]
MRLPLPDVIIPATVLGLPYHGGYSGRKPGLHRPASYLPMQQQQASSPSSKRLRRKAVCSGIPTQCEWFTDRKKFCSLYPMYCIAWETSDKDTVLANTDFRKNLMSNRSLEFTRLYGQRMTDLMAGCAVQVDTVSVCKNYVTISAVDSQGFPNNCVAIESLWGRPNDLLQKIPVTGKMTMMLKLYPEEYLEYFSLVQAHIFAHDPHSIVNPMKEGISLEAGKTYHIFVNMRMTIRLPAPYETNCTDYLELWKKNGGYGPLTGKACAEKCKMESMVESVGCVAQSISYPMYHGVCEDPNANPSQQIVEKCSRQCSEACSKGNEINSILQRSVLHSALRSEIRSICKERGDVQLHWWLHGHVVGYLAGVLVRSLGDTSLFARLPCEKQKKMGQEEYGSPLQHVIIRDLMSSSSHHVILQTEYWRKDASF